MTAPLRILTVCTGNICRSPMAASVLAQMLRDAGVPATLSSAGTAAVVDAAMPEPARSTLHALGVVPIPHRARQVDISMLRQADLVLAASREHRAAIARMYPRATRNTFTVVEFAHLVGRADHADLPREDGDALRAAVDAARRRRGEILLAGEPIDISDPYRRGISEYRSAGSRIMTAGTTIASSLAMAMATTTSV